MPTSPYAHLYPIVEFLNEARPASVLDIGLGNGKLGFIARDRLEEFEPFICKYNIFK